MPRAPSSSPSASLSRKKASTSGQSRCSTCSDAAEIRPRSGRDQAHAPSRPPEVRLWPAALRGLQPYARRMWPACSRTLTSLSSNVSSRRCSRPGADARQFSSRRGASPVERHSAALCRWRAVREALSFRSWQLALSKRAGLGSGSCAECAASRAASYGSFDHGASPLFARNASSRLRSRSARVSFGRCAGQLWNAAVALTARTRSGSRTPSTTPTPDVRRLGSADTADSVIGLHACTGLR